MVLPTRAFTHIPSLFLPSLPPSPQIRPEKLAYLKVKAKEYFLDPRNSERLDQVWVYIIHKYFKEAGNEGGGEEGCGRGAASL